MSPEKAEIARICVQCVACELRLQFMQAQLMPFPAMRILRATALISCRMSNVLVTNTYLQSTILGAETSACPSGEEELHFPLLKQLFICFITVTQLSLAHHALQVDQVAACHQQAAPQPLTTAASRPSTTCVKLMHVAPHRSTMAHQIIPQR